MKHNPKLHYTTYRANLPKVILASTLIGTGGALGQDTPRFVAIPGLELRPIAADGSISIPVSNSDGKHIKVPAWGYIIYEGVMLVSPTFAQAAKGAAWPITAGNTGAIALDIAATPAAVDTVLPSWLTTTAVSATVLGVPSVFAGGAGWLLGAARPSTNNGEVSPTFTLDTRISIDENSGTNQLIYTAIADGSFGPLTYGLDGTDSNAFNVDSDSGQVTLIADPDFETQPSYSFDVIATDDAGKTATQTVTLAINNLEDEAPVFTSGATATAINENSGANQVVYTASATDDVGPITYRRTGDAFRIDESNGEVTLVADPDFETQPSYSFDVIATDAAGKTATQTVTLAINNLDEESPVFTSDPTALISLDSQTGDVVYTASATDDVGPVFYSLDGTDAAAFDIDETNGDVTLTDTSVLVENSSYHFNVIATDGAGNKTHLAITLTVANPEDLGSIANSSVTLGLGLGFTVDSTNSTIYAPSASFDIIGSAGDDTIGRTSENNIAANGGEVNIDLGKGGKNTLAFGDSAANSGAMSIDGGTGDDIITFGNKAVFTQGNATIDLTAGGDNEVTFGDSAMADSTSRVLSADDKIEILGGTGNDTISFGDRAAAFQGQIEIDLTAGDNVLRFGNYAAGADNNSSAAREIRINGGAGDDTIIFGDTAARNLGVINIDLTDGGENTLSFGDNAVAIGGEIHVTGGSGQENITFTHSVGNGNAQLFTIDLGENDRAADIVKLNDDTNGLTISNFEHGIDRIFLSGVTANEVLDPNFGPENFGLRTSENAPYFVNVDIIGDFSATTSLNITTTVAGVVVS